ncbi:hypothetical protein WJX74_004033 [Apatococcus lobatus]|uniref:Uncharacterized protein n=1 Tax=Apatococcus lobatus TaxID=904363 RepID=A0AAW1SG00_9CHLO
MEGLPLDVRRKVLGHLNDIKRREHFDKMRRAMEGLWPKVARRQRPGHTVSGSGTSIVGLAVTLPLPTRGTSLVVNRYGHGDVEQKKVGRKTLWSLTDQIDLRVRVGDTLVSLLPNDKGYKAAVPAHLRRALAPRFLPELRRRRDQTRRMLDYFQANGNFQGFEV